MADRICNIEDCDRGGRIVRGMCSMHWQRWRKAVGPLPLRATQCSIEDCEKPPRGGRGMCEMHYARWRNHGDATASSCRDDSTVRFWRSVDKSADCWEWTGRLGNRGYGIHEANGKAWTASRFSYFLHHGYIPPGLFVCHHCDNRSCVNPAHLYAGTSQQNAQDKVDRNRCASMPGEENPFARLTASQVEAARRRYRVGGISQRALAEQFGISQTHVRRLINKEAWTHVQDF